MERKTPLQLLEPNDYDDINILQRHWGYLVGGAVGAFAGLSANVAARRPAFSGERFSFFTYFALCMNMTLDFYKLYLYNASS
jgi:hypothetical protein